jgi:hypothetical protein
MQLDYSTFFTAADPEDVPPRSSVRLVGLWRLVPESKQAGVCARGDCRLESRAPKLMASIQRRLAQRTQRPAQGSISSRSDEIEAPQRSHFP